MTIQYDSNKFLLLDETSGIPAVLLEKSKEFLRLFTEKLPEEGNHTEPFYLSGDGESESSVTMSWCNVAGDEGVEVIIFSDGIAFGETIYDGSCASFKQEGWVDGFNDENFTKVLDYVSPFLNKHHEAVWG